MQKLQVAEIFKSLHGEVNPHTQGRVVTFVRLSGCNLKCTYCDTAETQDPTYGKSMTIQAIYKKITELGSKYVCLTGGEPLLQTEGVLGLLNTLKYDHYVTVETNGTIDITPFSRYVDGFVVDYKLSAPFFTVPYDVTTLHSLGPNDVVKIVIADKDQFQHALKMIWNMQANLNHNLLKKPTFALSPCHPHMTGKALAKLILKEPALDVVMSVQLHKLVGVA